MVFQHPRELNHEVFKVQELNAQMEIFTDMYMFKMTFLSYLKSLMAFHNQKIHFPSILSISTMAEANHLHVHVVQSLSKARMFIIPKATTVPIATYCTCMYISIDDGCFVASPISFKCVMHRRKDSFMFS